MTQLSSGMPSRPLPGVGSLRPQPQPWKRYVAIGDSFTEGMSDRDPEVEDRYIGWADRLASLLAPHVDDFAYANLAVRGRKLKDVVSVQADAAIEMQPDLVSMIGGGNDILRPKVDLDDISNQLEAAVIRLRKTGADVLIATPSDPRGAPVIKHVRGRMATYSANIWRIAQLHGCYVLNQWSFDFLQDWRMWSEDRIHLSTEGHKRVALAAYTTLGHDPEQADWHVPLPPQQLPGRKDMVRANAEWAKIYAGPWVQRRLTGKSSGDFVNPKYPSLTPVDPSKGS